MKICGTTISAKHATWACALLVLLLATIIAAPARAFADEDVDTVRIGYYENEVFEEGASEGAIKTGYAYEYYRKVSEYTGWKYEYVYGNFSDLFQMLLDGDIDLLAGIAWREDLAGSIGYPESPMGSESYSLVKHGTDDSITAEATTLEGKKIGVLNSAMVEVLNQYLARHQVEADTVVYDDYEELFAAFDDGSIDVLAAEGDGAYGRDTAEVTVSFGSSDYYLCVTASRPDLLAELDVAQAQLAVEEPDYLNAIHSKYYPLSVSSRAFSPAEKEWINSHSALKVGYLKNYLPYSGTDDQGAVTGIVGDIVPTILTRLGIGDIEVTYVGYDSYDEMVSDASSGAIDVAFPIGGGLYYSEEHGLYQSSAVASASTELVYKGEYTDETIARFAVNENNRMQYYYVKTHFPDAEVTLYPSIDACLEAVVAGEVGCTTLNGLRANDILKNRAYNSLSLKQLNRSDDRCFGVQIGNEGLLKLLNRGINVVGSDYASNIASRYSNQLYSYSIADFFFDNIVLFVVAILGIAAILIGLLVRDSRRTRKQVADKERAQHVLEAKNEELEEHRAALADALVAAEHANRAKTTFLNNMSHDIRTPMNAIVGFTALAASHIDNKEQVQDYLGKISISSQHLLSLINDVLDMSRIESGKMTLEESETHLPDLIHDLRTIIQANITAKQQELFVDTQDVVHEDIVVDKLRLNQVLLNILSNAIKFTPPEGTIIFRVIEKPSTAPDIANFEFRIKDNGIGMSEEFQKTIFDAFTREQTSTVSGIQGTGLGMAISKNIVDMMGGTIEVASVEGKGTEFVVDIPCAISDKVVKYEQPPELVGLRALVADDDTNTCLSVCSMLREIGMRPDWTNYGKEAVIRTQEALEHGDGFMAYIIDWMMPDMNGIETVRRIRKIIGDSAPIIILTAYDWSDIEAEALEAGVTAFCSKPLFMSELRDVLTRPFRTDPEGNEEAFDFTGKRILLAEDNELNQQIAIAILEGVGLEVDVANDGVEAVEKMDASPAGTYDLIMMDIQMPRMDGHEATQRIRALDDPAKAGVPILAVTANAFEEDRKNALETGMDGHLAKPYDIPMMMNTLKNILG